jgi:hypothetical protein
MPSPFPGMNPYLEQAAVWQDFHQSFLPLAREVLTAQVRPAYVVKVEEHLFVHEAPINGRKVLGRSDVSVVGGTAGAPSAGPASAVAQAPITVLLTGADIERHAFLEIRDRANMEVVTVIELLSPSNKDPGPDREIYLAKRRRLLWSGTHLVEIDLLRGGGRLPPIEIMADYCVFVSRAEERPRAFAWPIHLRSRLPEIPIPLRPPHADARLDLQQVLHRLYDTAGYEDYIYNNEPEPPLSPEDAEWARQFAPAG